MMDILENIRITGETNGQRTAVRRNGDSLNYRDLDMYSDRLAVWIYENYPDSHTPVVVYGHKSPYMLVCFLACAKSGRAYCPLDISLPGARLKEIVAEVQPEVVFDLSIELLPKSERKKEDAPSIGAQEHDSGAQRFGTDGSAEIMTMEDVVSITHDKNAYPRKNYRREWSLGDEDTFYIIFTSGSTGKPKGVEITRSCLNNYLKWSVSLGTSMKDKEDKVFLNQAPFSFDLSVMDTYTSLACGGTLALMEKFEQEDYGKLMDFFKREPISIWVSTPSFADICMADAGFDEKLLPEMEAFLFCGEELTKRTYTRLRERFPFSRIINTYGPTESTVAVTGTAITDDVYEHSEETKTPLPVGYVKPGTFIEIVNEAGEVLPEGEHGEIIIIGDTVSKGYFHAPEKTAAAFFECERAGHIMRAYHTGDTGYIRGHQLYCQGRMDNQIKLHGYRIELGDIENNLLAIPEISQAVVTANEKDGKVKSLTGYVTLVREVRETESEITKYIKEKLRSMLPDYMVPKKIIVLPSMPVNANGKIDRKSLKNGSKIS